MSRGFAIGFVAALALGCHANPKPQAAPAAPVTPAATAPAATDAKKPVQLPDSVHWVRNSAEYKAATIQAYQLAGAALDQALARRKPDAGPWAVILDADETVIDNSLYEKEKAEQGYAFGGDTWHAFVARQVSKTVPGAQAFLRKVKAQGGVVAIVTNRDLRDCPATEANFRKEDLPYDVVLCKGDNGEKEPRFEQVRTGSAKPGLPGAEVLLWVGDNINDFPDQTQALRGQPESAFAAFGARFIVLPNPMYGSWERAERK